MALKTFLGFQKAWDPMEAGAEKHQSERKKIFRWPARGWEMRLTHFGN